MKHDLNHVSNNLEIDCLGKRTSITSPDARSAFACQDEVNALRETAVGSILRAGLEDKSISFKDGPERLSQATEAAQYSFDNFVGLYDKSPKSLGESFMSLFKSDKEDTFQSRELDFSHQLFEQLSQ